MTSPEQIREFIEASADEHQELWQEQLLGDAPDFDYMLALHLRLVELEHLEHGVKELL